MAFDRCGERDSYIRRYGHMQGQVPLLRLVVQYKWNLMAEEKKILVRRYGKVERVIMGGVGGNSEGRNDVTLL